jgi:hypothetical protein
MLKKFRLLLCFWCVLLLGGLLTLVAWPSLPVQAQEGLPPRETPAPQPPADDDDDDDSGASVGAYIELHVALVSPDAWSVVQWEDSAGNWHNVEGWQGELGLDGFERWWVAAKDFNTGPFRWLVTQSQAGPELGVSQPFNLPGGGNQVIRVTVTLD